MRHARARCSAAMKSTALGRSAREEAEPRKRVFQGNKEPRPSRYRRHKQTAGQSPHKNATTSTASKNLRVKERCPRTENEEEMEQENSTTRFRRWTKRRRRIVPVQKIDGGRGERRIGVEVGPQPTPASASASAEVDAARPPPQGESILARTRETDKKKGGQRTRRRDRERKADVESDTSDETDAVRADALVGSPDRAPQDFETELKRVKHKCLHTETEQSLPAVTLISSGSMADPSKSTLAPSIHASATALIFSSAIWRGRPGAHLRMCYNDR